MSHRDRGKDFQTKQRGTLVLLKMEQAIRDVECSGAESGTVLNGSL